jgi:heme/copper-type cytochrome/quinol oxidase subunit 2
MPTWLLAIIIGICIIFLIGVIIVIIIVCYRRRNSSAEESFKDNLSMEDIGKVCIFCNQKYYYKSLL